MMSNTQKFIIGLDIENANSTTRSLSINRKWIKYKIMWTAWKIGRFKMWEKNQFILYLLMECHNVQQKYYKTLQTFLNCPISNCKRCLHYSNWLYCPVSTVSYTKHPSIARVTSVKSSYRVSSCRLACQPPCRSWIGQQRKILEVILYNICLDDLGHRQNQWT